MPNVFMNTELIKALDRNYNPKMRELHLHDGSQFMIITRDYNCMVFQLDTSLKTKLRMRDLLEECCTMDTSYKSWKLPMHRIKGPRNQPRRFSNDERPPLPMDLFEEYY